MNLQEKTRNFFQNYVFFERKHRFRGTKPAWKYINIYVRAAEHLWKFSSTSASAWVNIYFLL